MKKETINTYNKEVITLIISDDGYCFCPVCGEKAKEKEWRPYDESGLPTYDICSCGFEYGFDDGGEPPYNSSWDNYRTKWLNGKVNGFGQKHSKTKKLQQLKNIGL